MALIGTAHFLGVERQRVLITGPTGSGKSHIARSLAEGLDRPLLEISVPDLTGTGWKGVDLPDALVSLQSQAGGSLAGAVLLLDEVDKVRADAEIDGNSREAKLNIQASMLALLSGQVVTPEIGRGQMETARMLVIGTASFGDALTGVPTTDDLVRLGWTRNSRLDGVNASICGCRRGRRRSNCFDPASGRYPVSSARSSRAWACKSRCRWRSWSTSQTTGFGPNRICERQRN
jgi:hypothetical protein